MRGRILTVLLALGLLGPAVAAGGPRAVAGTTGTVPVWAAEFMARNVTMTETLAVAQAERFDVIAALPIMYKNFVGAMRAANPDLVLLAYLNATFAQNTQGDTYPADWYERDADGTKVQSRSFGNYLMIPTRPGWIADTVSRCQTAIANSGYDGCFLDMLGIAPLLPNYVTGLPINPATGDVWTRGAWLGATATLAARVRDAVAPAHVYGNGLANGTLYFAAAPTSRILDGLEGAMAETFIRDPGALIDSYRNETRWKQDVDMLADAGARGKVALAMTKVWTTGTQGQKDSWHRYALASFLLGYTPGFGFFSFRYDHGSTMPHPYWDVSIGDPVGPYAKVDGAYQRAFTGGKVLVNPTTAAVTVNLGATYTTLGGQRVSSLTLQPHTGEVLTTR